MKIKNKNKINRELLKIITLALVGTFMISSFVIYSVTFAQTENANDANNIETTDVGTTENLNTETTKTPVQEVAEQVAEIVEPLKVAPLGEIDRDIAKMREHIEKNNLPEKFLQRLEEFKKENAGAIANDEKPKEVILSEVPRQGNDKHPFKVVGDPKTINKVNERDFISKIKSKKNSIAFKDTFKLKKSEVEKDFNNLKSSVSSESIETSSYQFSPQLQSGFTTLENETKESKSIRDKATELGNNPLKILNFVREHVKYEPYYGSKKGAEATLLEGEGNDADQASLLIALLRAGGTQARYHHGVVKLTLRDVMDMVGADNPELAAKILGGANIPYSLYVDQNDSPLFFIVEMFWVEAFIEYGPYGGATESLLTEKKWIPMVPGLVPTYYFQSLDAVEGLNNSGFNITTFYENYLEGDYGALTPIDAFEAQVANFVATQEGKNMSDAKTTGYRGFNKFEFIPRTLPFSIVTDYGTYENIPDILRHKTQFKVATTATTFLDYSAYTSDIANSELLITYDPATEDDATFLASFPAIYDVVPLSLLQLKPALKINGAVIAGGSGGAPEINAGTSATLGLTFFAPKRSITGEINLTQTEHAEKSTIAGNTEAIAISTGNVMPPELRPGEDTVTTSFVKDQKLYRTALNYLDRLETNHHRLAEFTGGTFADLAIRAVISNSLAVTSVSGVPYSFSWKGLNIDSSSLVRYHSRFGPLSGRHMKEFTYIFGLEASLDESTIFENDYGVDAVSTVKALRLINQGIIPGQVIKITSANSSIIDTMNISTEIKNKMKDDIAEGNVIYTPTAPFTYNLWTGMVYIVFDPVTGSGNYVIGEGLNGGYTVSQLIAMWKDLFSLNKAYALEYNVTIPQLQVRQGDILTYTINYIFKFLGSVIGSFNELVKVNTDSLPLGPYPITPKYNAVPATVPQPAPTINTKCYFGDAPCDYDKFLFDYGALNGIPGDLLKSMIHQESAFDPFAYRYEAHRDYDWYSGPAATSKDRIESHPFRHFAIGGTAIHGPVIAGDQIPPKSEYILWSRHTSGYPNGLNMNDRNNDGRVTAQELYDNNNDYYWKKYRGADENWDFTPQLVIASSYGLMQALYETAVTRMVILNLETKRLATSPNEHPSDAVPIEKLFDPEFSVKIGSGYLKNRYDRVNDWWTALRDYNGEGQEAVNYANAVFTRWNNGNGIYKPISN